MKQRNRFQNETKKRTLEVLECKISLDVPTIAKKVGIQPVRRAYTYLSHLEEMGLVERPLDAQGKLHCRITTRGLARLQWLRAQERVPIIDDLVRIIAR